MSDDQRADAAQPPATQHEPPLTDKELREVREIMEADRRVKWFWATSRRIAIWLGAVFGGLVVTWDWLVRVVKHMAGS